MIKRKVVCAIVAIPLGIGVADTLTTYADWHSAVVILVGAGCVTSFWLAIYICILLPLFIRWRWI